MDEASPDYARIMGYIDRNPAAVLSTVNDDGTPHGAAVYVIRLSHQTLCLVTKTETLKYHNLTQRATVALTFYNELETSTLQIIGNAYRSESDQMVEFTLTKLTKAHAIQTGWVPPVTKVQAGEYAVIGIDILHARLSEYQGAGTSPTVTELAGGTDGE
jgi:general stress protein 26